MSDAPTPSAEVAAYLAAHGRPERVELLTPDLNGVLRGKWLPGRLFEKLSGEAGRLPYSTLALNIFGEDVDETGLALPMGDPDGGLHLAPGTLAPVPWAPAPTAQALVAFAPEPADAAGHPADPRAVLAAVLERYHAQDLHPIVALELEFYLFEAAADPEAPRIPARGLGGAQVYDLERAGRCADVLCAIEAACAAQSIPLGPVLAEFGPAQFEINFEHDADPMRAADRALLFKRVVRRVAEAHGLEASFAAKPYGDEAGSGLHIHMSLLDGAGANVFAAGGDAPIAPRLHGAVGGSLALMPALQALFAPHANSYRRFAPGEYAPLTPSWAEDHRGVAVRLPAVTGKAARLEHRISGADAHPHLALAAVLAGALHGMEHRIDPGPSGPRRPSGDGLTLHRDWEAAVEAFAASGAVASVLGAEFQRIYAAMRRSEINAIRQIVPAHERRLYVSRF